jgi:succinate dehydrogenase/fumarate reductase flavoprotein subunit
MEVKCNLPDKWDFEADVVVVGYGGAGSVAAITAHDAGAKVLILEKAPLGQEGGNTRVAGQGWLNPFPIEQAITYFNAMCGEYTVPQDMVQAWAEEMNKNNAFIESLGAVIMETVYKNRHPAEFPELPGADCIHDYHIRTDDGSNGYSRLWETLKGAVNKRGIKVLCATPVKELIQNPATKEIFGVKAEHSGRKMNIKANRAVVLTCGGFENNQEMVRDFCTNLPYCYPLGTPYNTGDGIKMAMAAGADLWHMSCIAGPVYCSLKVPEFPAILEIPALEPQARAVFPGGVIVVGADARRFADEKYRVTHGKSLINGRWAQTPTPCPLHMIFDQTIFNVGLYDSHRYHGWNPLLNVYTWSKDNSAELAKGWIKKANSIAELAQIIKLDPKVLQETVYRWNMNSAAGHDPDFGRTRMVAPIEGPPFYAMEVTPHFVNTQGGPRRNAKSQILQVNGEPLPRLYGAGELGSIHSYLYNSGGNIGECLAFGRISGRNAAAEKGWS